MGWDGTATLLLDAIDLLLRKAVCGDCVAQQAVRSCAVRRPGEWMRAARFCGRDPALVVTSAVCPVVRAPFPRLNHPPHILTTATIPNPPSDVWAAPST